MIAWQHTDRRPAHPRDRVSLGDAAALCGSVFFAVLFVVAVIQVFCRRGM